MHTIDTVRGICILGMILYHTLFDCVMIFGLDYSLLDNTLLSVIRDVGAACFIFLAGVCFYFEKHHFRRAIVLNVCGIIISVVTFLVMPDSPVIFGILTFMGMSGLLLYALSRFLRYVPAVPGMIISFVSFLIFFRCNYGYSGSYQNVLFQFPDTMYRNYLTAFFGFPSNGFVSSDYFSLFPWFFIVLCGYFFGKKFLSKAQTQRLMYKKIPFVTSVGKFSLYVYMAHQPLVYGLVALIFVIIHKTR